MNVQTELCDQKFVPFLHNLSVETYKKTFEWMLNDPDFAGILQWLYSNLDHNNALTAREEYRYAELEKKGCLSPEDLQSTISAIQQQYPGISLPGDQEALEDVKQDICMQQERLHVLERQERVVKDLISQNKLIKEELTVEITKLNSAYHQYAEDKKTASEECLQLAKQVESMTECVVDLIADTLDVYTNCHIDNDVAKKFLTFGPLDSYKQTQALFCSHFDLYTSKKFNHQHDFNDEDLKSALIEARSMEERLSQALCSYIDTKAELAGEQAKLALVENYNHIHPSQITVCSLEAQTALDLLTQEESILEQQTQVAMKELITWRTRLAVDTAIRSAFTIREQIQVDLNHLLEVCHQALALDRVLFYGLRHELRTVEDLVQFAAQLKEYVVSEKEAVASRIDSMNSICSEQGQCELKLQSSDSLTLALSSILGTTHTEPDVLAKLYSDLVIKVQALSGDVKEGYWRKEGRLRELPVTRIDQFLLGALSPQVICAVIHYCKVRTIDQTLKKHKSSLQPLHCYIYDGCTKQPNCRDRTVAALTHALQTEMDAVEKRVSTVGTLFTTTKNADKHNLRKLWQWFLTDEARLLAAMKGVPRN